MIIFIHGLESSGSGYKGRFFKKIFFDKILTPDFTGNLNNRMNKLNKILNDYNDIVIIGSSFGGLMGTIYTAENPNKVKKLILLAPALTFVDIKEKILNYKITVPTIIFHGKNDDVVSLIETKKIAKKIFQTLTFNEVDDDHFLHKTIDKVNWEKVVTD